MPSGQTGYRSYMTDDARHDRYVAALKLLDEARDRWDALREKQPLTLPDGRIPLLQQEHIDAMDGWGAAQAEYIEARDDYYNHRG